MKQHIIIIFLSVTNIIAQAQLNIISNKPDLKEYSVQNAVAYDSLSNISAKSCMGLPGQTLFMCGAKNTGQGYVETFYTDNFLAVDKPKIYKGEHYSTPADAVAGKYFEVEKVLTKPAGSTLRYALLLREKESGDKVYYKATIYPRAMICMGYYEKLKSRYIGKTFLSLGLRVETMEGGIVTPEVGSEYRCKDVGVEIDKDGAILILENESGEQVKATPVDDEIYEFITTERRDHIIKKYGHEYGSQIALRQVALGMTPEMVLEAWGEPYRKSACQNETETAESWAFDRNRYVNFENGKAVYVSSYNQSR